MDIPEKAASGSASFFKGKKLSEDQREIAKSGKRGHVRKKSAGSSLAAGRAHFLGGSNSPRKTPAKPSPKAEPTEDINIDSDEEVVDPEHRKLVRVGSAVKSKLSIGGSSDYQGKYDEESIAKKDMMEFGNVLQDLCDAEDGAASSSDTRLVAEIGQMLLEKNLQLEEQMLDLQKQVAAAKSEAAQANDDLLKAEEHLRKMTFMAPSPDMLIAEASHMDDGTEDLAVFLQKELVGHPEWSGNVSSDFDLFRTKLKQERRKTKLTVGTQEQMISTLRDQNDEMKAKLQERHNDKEEIDRLRKVSEGLRHEIEQVQNSFRLKNVEVMRECSAQIREMENSIKEKKENMQNYMQQYDAEAAQQKATIQSLRTALQRKSDKLDRIIKSQREAQEEKISCLYVGAEALIEDKDTVQSMIGLLTSDSTSPDDVYCIASTLSQLYATLPDAPVPEVDIKKLLCPPESLDVNMRASYVDMVVELVDTWGLALPVAPLKEKATLHEPHLVPGANPRASVSVSTGSSYTLGMSSTDEDGVFLPHPAITRFIGSLQSTSNTRAKGVGSALRELHTLIEAKKSYAVQAANLGTVQILYRKGFLLEHNGHYRAWETLAFLSGTTAGMQAIHEAQIIRFILFDLSSATKPSMHLLYAICMLEGILQKPGVADEVFDLQGVETMVQFVLNHGVLSVEDAYDSLNTDTMELGNVKGTFEEELLARDFAFVCLPMLRCLRYVFRCVSRERAIEMKKMLVPLGHLLNLDVDLTDADRSDFQTLLMSLLVTVGALNMSYLDWIVRARQQVNAAQDDYEPLLSVDYNQRSSGRRVTISMKGTAKPEAPDISKQQEEALRSGFLEKQMIWRQSWKNRWCILTPTSLFYYKIKGGKPAGIVPLAQCEIHQKSEQQYFDIVLKSKRIKLRAASPEDASNWIRAIELAKDKLGPLPQVVEEPKPGIAARLKGMLSHEKKSDTSSPQQSPRSQNSNRSRSPSQSRAFSYGQQSLSDAGSVFPASIRQSEVIRRAGETTSRSSLAVPVEKPAEQPVLDFEAAHLTRPGSTVDLNPGLPGIDETQAQPGTGQVPDMTQIQASTRSNRHIRHESWTFPRPP